MSAATPRDAGPPDAGGGAWRPDSAVVVILVGDEFQPPDAPTGDTPGRRDNRDWGRRVARDLEEGRSVPEPQHAPLLEAVRCRITGRVTVLALGTDQSGVSGVDKRHRDQDTCEVARALVTWIESRTGPGDRPGVSARFVPLRVNVGAPDPDDIRHALERELTRSVDVVVVATARGAPRLREAVTDVVLACADPAAAVLAGQPSGHLEVIERSPEVTPRFGRLHLASALDLDAAGLARELLEELAAMGDPLAGTVRQVVDKVLGGGGPDPGDPALPGGLRDRLAAGSDPRDAVTAWLRDGCP